MKEKKMKKENAHDWLSGMSLELFKEVWTDWYLPALTNLSHNVKQLDKKMDEIIKRLTNETTS